MSKNIPLSLIVKIKNGEISWFRWGSYSQEGIVFESSPIKKIGKNKYKVVNSGYRGYTCTIAVKKKTITVKFTSPKGAMKVGKNGTYKLK